MAVTDLTDSLPWWARGGAGPTGGPGAAPQGSGVGGQPPQGVNQQAWLQYLMQMFSPGSANAAEAPPTNGGPSPDDLDALKHPSPPPAALDGGGPPVPPSVLQPATDPATRNMPFPQDLGPASRNMPFPGQIDPRGYFAPSASPNAPAPNAQPVSAQRPVPGPLASGGASAQGATSNPRFVQLDQGQNTDPTARNRGPQMTALNLAGLFGGGGQPAAAPAANPANLPARNAQPVSGPLAAGGMSNAPWGVGPLQKGMVWPKDMGPFKPKPRSGSGYGDPRLWG